MTDQKELDEMQRKFEAELKKQPEVSDEDWMREFEVSDDEYKRGFTLPATQEKSHAKKG